MSPPSEPRPVIWRAFADDQQGIVSRGQLLQLGLTHAQAHQNVDNGRWRTLLPGVYATFTGPVGPIGRVWASVLYAGEGAVASHSTALWLGGAMDELSWPIHVSVGHGRRVREQRGLRIHRSVALELHRQVLVHPAVAPPRMRIEAAVLDQAAIGTELAAVDVVLRAIQRRLTTAARVRDVLARRHRHQWRRLLLEVTSDAAQGVASPLERRYLRDVERPHGLPVGQRNRQEPGGAGRHEYRDVRYLRWQTVVELDGREAHPPEEAFRDLRRDNRAVVDGDSVLRYGWRDVIGSPCLVARQVDAVLRARGWGGAAGACSAECTVRRTA